MRKYRVIAAIAMLGAFSFLFAVFAESWKYESIAGYWRGDYYSVKIKNNLLDIYSKSGERVQRTRFFVKKDDIRKYILVRNDFFACDGKYYDYTLYEQNGDLVFTTVDNNDHVCHYVIKEENKRKF